MQREPTAGRHNLPIPQRPHVGLVTYDAKDPARAQQYLDRVYVEREPPPDWIDLQSEAGRVVDMAEARGRDAGRLFADLLRTSPTIEPVVALRLLTERLMRHA